MQGSPFASSAVGSAGHPCVSGSKLIIQLTSGSCRGSLLCRFWFDIGSGKTLQVQGFNIWVRI